MSAVTARAATLSSLPWSADHVGGVITSADGFTVGLLRYSHDWQYAIRAVNTHAQLLEALRDYDDAFTDFDPASGPSRDRMRLAVVKARAALAAVGAQS